MKGGAPAIRPHVPKDGSTMGQTACAGHRTSRPTNAGAARLPVSETGRFPGNSRSRRHAGKCLVCRGCLSGAAQESNLPTHGLHAPAGFEGQTGFAQRIGLKDVCAPGRALEVRCFALTSLGLVSASLEAWDGQGCGRDVPAIWRASKSSACARCSGWVPEQARPSPAPASFANGP
jgi:hypothetical protein